MSNAGDRAAVLRTTKVRTKLKGDGSWLQQRNEPEPETQEEEKPWLAEVRARRLNGAPIETSPVSSPVKSTPPPVNSDSESKPATQGYLIRGVFTKLDKPVSTAPSNGTSKPKIFTKKPSEAYRKIAPHIVRNTSENPEGQLSPEEQEKRTEAAISVMKPKAAKQRSYVLSAAKLYEAKETSPDTSLTTNIPSFVAKRVEVVDDESEGAVTPAPANTEAPSPAVPPTSAASAPTPKARTAVNNTVKKSDINQALNPKATEPVKKEPLSPSEQVGDEATNAAGQALTDLVSTEPQPEDKTPLFKLFPASKTSPAQNSVGLESPASTVTEPPVPVPRSAPTAASPAPVAPVPTGPVTELLVKTKPEPEPEKEQEPLDKFVAAVVTEAETEPEVEQKPEPEVKVEAEQKQELEPEKEQEPLYRFETAVVFEVETEPEVEQKPEPEVKVEAEQKQELEPEEQSEPQDETPAEIEVEAVSAVKVETEVEPEPESSPELQLEPEPSAEPSSSSDTLAALSDTLLSLDTKNSSTDYNKPDLAEEEGGPADSPTPEDSAEQEPTLRDSEPITGDLLGFSDGPEEPAEPVPSSPGRWSLDLLGGLGSESSPVKTSETLDLMADDVIMVHTEARSLSMPQQEEEQTDETAVETQSQEDHGDTSSPDVTTTVPESSSADPFDPYPMGTASHNSPSDLLEPIADVSINSSATPEEETKSTNPEMTSPTANLSQRSWMTEWEIPQQTNTEESQEPEKEDQAENQETLIMFEKKSSENDSPWDRWTSPTVYTVSTGEEDEEEEEDSPEEPQTITVTTVREIQNEPEPAMDQSARYSTAAAEEERRVPTPETDTKKPFVYVREYVDSTSETSVLNPMDNLNSWSDDYSSRYSLSSSTRVSLSSNCTYCGNKVGNEAKITIEHLSINCHPECFKCGVCSRPMGDLLANMFLHNRKVHCESCYAAVV
ncbi:PREDICTED: zinc finger protein 185-like [Cyprinodon variegatus]|uniref:Zinc finger protein 185-like n=1 Tax=Cyprinodon variegatus TaxID=28743 RepID=A0A3Q2GQT5_CYPVA|nr:PREDICTED: zinc finger protein 185-like [Cyprinodon variegatus]